MDKNTLTGLLLSALIIFGFTWYTSKQNAEYEKQQKVADSIAYARKKQAEDQLEIAKRERDSLALQSAPQTQTPATAPVPEAPAAVSQDSLLKQNIGTELYEALRAGEEKSYTLENEVLTLTISGKGAKVVSAKLKDYTRNDLNHKGQQVDLYAPGSAAFDMEFFMMKGFNPVAIHTEDYNFTPVPSADPLRLPMRLQVDEHSYVEFIYRISPGDYMVDFTVNFVGMEGKFTNQTDLLFTWGRIGPQYEKGFDNENNYSNISYKYPGEKGIENIGVSKAAKEKRVPNKVQWVAFKQQFFSSIFVAADSFGNADMRYETYAPGGDNLKKFSASLAVPFERNQSEYDFRFYYGPNKYSVLKKYDLGMQKLIPLGGWIIGWVNTLIVIPVFDWLGKFISSFGLVILILTIFIKLLIFPLTYKSYLSSAKMRLLKPEIDAINEKFPKKDDAMKKQQAIMGLYKSAGVSPMGGCIPMLIQFPILIAMFRFFPASIELRGKAFLWAEDLSAYDSILDLPFNIPFYGDHVSLFTLLMAVALHISSRISYSQQAAATPQMGSMKFMMLWLMPIMLMLWFNNYASGLSYYYLLSNLITIGQTVGIRYVVNDEKLHARMKENAKKQEKTKSKSKWQQRLEDMQRAQQQQARQQAGGKKGKR